MSSEEREPRPKVTKRPSWWKLFPAEYAEANRLVQENVAQYTPAKLAAMNLSSRLKVHSDLLNKVGLILPLKWKTATPNAVADFVGNQKRSHRRKGGTRRPPDSMPRVAQGDHLIVCRVWLKATT